MEAYFPPKTLALFTDRIIYHKGVEQKRSVPWSHRQVNTLRS
jgi:hypothetical protein